MPWDARNCVVQTIRATHDFYSVKGARKLNPWHDSVAVQSPVHGVTWYAQLRMLFQWGERCLALVRWYDGVNVPDNLTKFGCVRLKWETVGRNNQPRYQVIELDNIIRRVFVVKDYNPVGNVGCFHVSAFKWDRLIPDRRGILEKDRGICVDESESDGSSSEDETEEEGDE